VPLLGERHAGKGAIDMIDVDNLIGLFYNVDVFEVKFDKDINRYEKANPRRRHSFYDLEIENYHETFKPLEIEPDLHLGDNEGDQKVRTNKIKAASLVDQEELKKLFEELLEQEQI